MKAFTIVQKRVQCWKHSLNSHLFCMGFIFVYLYNNVVLSR